MFLLSTKAVATDANSLEMLSAIIKNIEFKDIIDMLLVIYLVYKALQFLRDTRAMQLLKGLLLLVGLYIVVDFFELGTMRFILHC